MSDHPKKLIEVALPLDEINAACKADKDRKTGTIRNLHKWFAPMPLPAWRALIYSALIDDPDDDEKRAYHLDLIKRLVANGADLPDEETILEARANIEAQFPDGPPPVMDPFCGGGSTLVEAQRLGLSTFGSDLNPVPVLITRTLTELLPLVFGQQPLHPEMSRSDPPARRQNAGQGLEAQSELPLGAASVTYQGYGGFARDVLHYAELVRDEAWQRLEDHYPIEVGETPIAWLWARTVQCSNPACQIETILTTSWWLSKKTESMAWIEPDVSGDAIDLRIISGRSDGEAPASPKVGRGASFSCISCGALIKESHVIDEGLAGRLGLRMTCVVADTSDGRIYRAPTQRDLEAVELEGPEGVGDLTLGPVQRFMSPPRFGFFTQADLYTNRQLRTLTVFADLVASLPNQIRADGGSKELAEAVTTLLGLSVGRLAHTNSQQTRWNLRNASYQSKAEPGFGRNDVPMNWDFAEPFMKSGSVGDWMGIIESQLRALAYATSGQGSTLRLDARFAHLEIPGLVATDPPYFDAIGYADLSDFFYVWHRRSLREVHPDLYNTMAAPRHGELTAIPSHHSNDRDRAKDYFIDGFTEAFTNLQRSLAPGLPLIVVYASKEQKAGAGEETRWAAILTAMLQANLEITGTWPIHGTGVSRMVGQGANAVAAYVAMTCRPRPSGAAVCTLSDFNRLLRRELKPAVERLQAAGILPVDLAQAAMGPGMQVYSRYKAVLDQAGDTVPVDQALRLINQALTEVLDEQEGELDPDSRFATTLWEKHHWGDAPFGEADQVARPQGIAVDDVVRAKVAAFPRPGFIKLLGHGDLDRTWSPNQDARPTAWEAVHHLADRLIDGGGISEAGALMAELSTWRDQAQALVYRLHAIAARKGWTEDQERYNALIGSWSDLLAEAGRVHDNGDGLF